MNEKPNKFSLMTDYDIGVLLSVVPSQYSTDDIKQELYDEAANRNLIKDVRYLRTGAR